MESLEEHLRFLACPKCRSELRIARQCMCCQGCGEEFASGCIPNLFWPNEWEGAGDVTDVVKAFYEQTPFPDYDDFDSVASLQRKARAGRFARLLDEQVPPRTRILECGCGTGQLSSFLSVGGRTVFATDMCLNSLRLGRDFAQRHRLDRVHFVQMNLFRPAFKEEAFHLVIANGVLHHTSNPRLGFETLARMVKPGGYLLVGLYNKCGRWITDARRKLFRITGDRLRFLDPNMRRRNASEARKQAWFADQYCHPHESKHSFGEVLGWLSAAGLRFVNCLPSSRPFQPLPEKLFENGSPGNAFERFLVETGMIFTGSREGGFFVVIGKRV